MKAQVIVADPAWGFNDELKKMRRSSRRSAASQYTTMSPAQIAALPVRDIADPRGCLLALWVPGSLLVQGIDVLHAWGFSLRQTWVWVKLKKDHAQESNPNNSTRVGMGRLFRQSHEIALIGVSGKSIYPFLQDRSQRSVGFDLNVGHSTKPETLQDRLDVMFPNTTRIELFARRQRPGWTCLGNAIDGADLSISIPAIANDENVL